MKSKLETMSVVNYRHILGMRVDATSYEEATKLILTWAEQGQSKYVCAANVHMVMETYDNSLFARVVNDADLVTPDGMPLVWGLRALGFNSAERVCGPILTLTVCQAAAQMNIPVALYGGTPESLASFTKFLENRFSAIKIVCQISPPFRPPTPEENKAYTHTILQSGAGIILVGIGCPRQEMWMAEHREQIPAVMIGVGAAFDFYSGRVKQAPHWMQQIGLEWLFRLIVEPRRLWKRYFKHNPRFIFLFLRQLQQHYFPK